MANMSDRDIWTAENDRGLKETVQGHLERVVPRILIFERFDPAPLTSRENSACYPYANGQRDREREKEREKESVVKRQIERILSLPGSVRSGPSKTAAGSMNQVRTREREIKNMMKEREREGKPLPGSVRSGPPKTAVGSKEPGNDLEAGPVGIYTPDPTQIIALLRLSSSNKITGFA